MALKTKHKWLRWFQRSYDTIDNWDYPDEWKPAIELLNDMIPKVLRDSMLAFIKEKYEDSADRAKDEVRNVIAKLGMISKQI